MKSKIQISSLTEKSGNTLNEDFDIATNFNTFLLQCPVFTHEDNSYMPQIFSMVNEDNTKFSNVNFAEEDVLSTLDKLRADKAAGPDDLSRRLLVEITNDLCYPLFLLFRKPWTSPLYLSTGKGQTCVQSTKRAVDTLQRIIDQ